MTSEKSELTSGPLGLIDIPEEPVAVNETRLCWHPGTINAEEAEINSDA
jgi:hypothetical protein